MGLCILAELEYFDYKLMFPSDTMHIIEGVARNLFAYLKGNLKKDKRGEVQGDNANRGRL